MAEKVIFDFLSPSLEEQLHMIINPINDQYIEENIQKPVYLTAYRASPVALLQT